MSRALLPLLLALMFLAHVVIGVDCNFANNCGAQLTACNARCVDASDECESGCSNRINVNTLDDCEDDHCDTCLGPLCVGDFIAILAASCKKGCGYADAIIQCCTLGCPSCVNGGTCDANNPRSTCTCTGGYTGTTCNIPPAEPTPTPCDSEPCKNGGTCAVGANNAVVCACPAGFNGNYCEQAVTGNANGELSPEAQAGIAVGVVLMLLIAAGAVVAFFVLTKRNPFKKASQKGSTMQLTSVTSERVPVERKRQKPLPHTGETTILNTDRSEIVLPGYLMLNYDDLFIEKQISKGGGGVIYAGSLKHDSKQEPLVIKHFKDLPGLTDEENTQNFEQEISTMHALSINPNVVKLTGYCATPRCMVMPKMDGDLYHLIHDSSVSFTDSIRLTMAKEIASALAACHSIGVVHRDIKTPNVLFKRLPPGSLSPFQLFLSDFGVCSVRDSGAVKGRVFINIFGLSYKYAAPEVFSRAQMNSYNGVDFEEESKSDAYAYSVCLWEIVTRDVPWNKVSSEDIKRRVSAGERPPMPNPVTDLDKVMIDLIGVCWSQDLWARPRLSEVCQKLHSLDGLITTSSREPVALVVAASPATAPKPKPKPPIPSLPPKQPSPATVPVLPSQPRVPIPPPTPAATARQPYRALYDYVATKPDELTIKAGDFFELSTMHPDGWATVTNVATHEQGLIPGNYVQQN